MNKDAAAELEVTTSRRSRPQRCYCNFGDKYGDIVRVVRIGCGDVVADGAAGASVASELCGGTHVHNVGEVFPLCWSVKDQ